MGVIKAREENKPDRHLFDFVGAGPICALASAIVLAVACVPTPALPQTANVPFGDVTHHVVRLDGVRFHYVAAGSGEPVVLLPGWPESWIAWRKMIPLFVSAGRQVYVLDPRGLTETNHA